MNVLSWICGIICILIGFSIVVKIDYEEERVFASAAFILGIVGGFLLCLCNYIGG